MTTTIKVDNFIPTYDKLLGRTIIINGITGSGKTTMLTNLLYAMSGKIDAAYLFSETADMTGDFDGIIHPACIFDKFNESVLESIVNRQQAILLKLREMGRIDLWKNFNVVIILDDFSTDAATWRSSKQVIKLATQSRHFNITFIIAVQYLMTCPPLLRQNARLIFATSLTSDGEINVFYRECWNVALGKKNVCTQFIESIITGKGEFIVVINEATDGKAKALYRCKSKMLTAEQRASIQLYSDRNIRRIKKVYIDDWQKLLLQNKDRTKKIDPKNINIVIANENENDEW